MINDILTGLVPVFSFKDILVGRSEMNIERSHSDKPTYIGSVRRQKNGEFDPVTASEHEVIARFLIQAGHLKDSDEAARYASLLLNISEEGHMSNADYLMRIRLREIIKGLDASDDRWEDEDDVAGEIYAQLRFTIDRSDEFRDQRDALRHLLRLRGADVQLDSDAKESDNLKRWDVLLRKIGSKALRGS
jgi:hypothetical protein